MYQVRYHIQTSFATMAASMSRFYRKFCTQTTTPQTFKTLLANLSKERNLSKVVKIFKELSDSKRFRGVHRPYQDTIRRLASAKKFSDIEEVLEHQKQYEDITDEGFAVRLISLYGKAGMLDHASKLFDEMPQLKCERTVKSFNALLQACVQAKQFGKVEKLFRELPSSLGITLNERSYNIVVQALCEMKSLDSAELMLGEMESNGFQPSLITFNILMNGFYLDGRFSDGERIWDRLEKSGIALDVVSFNAKLQGFLHWGKISEAVDLLEEMDSRELKPDVITYNTLIRWCCNDGDLDRAKAMHERMVKNGCVLNRTTFQALIPILCKNGDFDLALKLCEESQSLYINLDVRILQTVVNGLVKDLKVEKAENFVNLVKSKSDGRLKLRMPCNVD